MPATRSKKPRIDAKKATEAMPARDRTKIEFDVDERGMQILRDMTEEAGFPSVTATIAAALHIVRALQSQAKEGYSDVLVQNPQTLDQRMLVMKSLSPR